MQVLGRRSGNNPLLIGEPGVGKTAIVEGLAQRIADHRIPEFLQEKRILALAPDRLVDSTTNRRNFEHRFAELIAEVAQNLDLILFIDGLFDPATPASSPFRGLLGRLLAPLSVSQCIATGTPAGFRAAVERDPVVERHFRAIEIAPPNEQDTILILARLKRELEQYHGVVYDASAIETAVRASVQFMPRLPLPGKATDLLDEVGARIKLRLEKQKHEGVLQTTVIGADIEELVSEMTGISVEAIHQHLAKN